MRMILGGIVLCLLMVLPVVSWGQSDTLYFDSNHQPSTKDSSKYYWLYQLIPGHYYKVNEYTINNQRLTITGVYSELNTKSKDGAFIFYDDSGYISREGNFAHNNEVGEWKEYYEHTKSLWCVKHYNDGKLSGLTSYYKDGKIKRQETDNDGKAAGKCYDTTGKEIPFTRLEVLPKPDYDLNKYLSDNLVYPERARRYNTQGRVLIKFVVDETGKIKDVTVIKHVSPEIDAEALRVISKMPPWQPGIQDDKVVKVYFTQPLTFNLQ